MWPLAALTGDHINGVFYKEMYGHFGGPKKSGRNNKVTCILEVAKSRGSSFLSFHSFISFILSFLSDNRSSLWCEKGHSG